MSYKKIITILISIGIIVFAYAYLYAMNLLGGFQTLPNNNPVPEISIKNKSNKIEIDSNEFKVAILGDMRWGAAPRIGVLEHAQKQQPLFMINLADATEFARKEEWKIYINELVKYWNKKTPYLHIPGGHSQNIKFSGIKPYFYEYYFGQPYYDLNVKNWKFIFLNSGLGYFNRSQIAWLKQTLEDAKKNNQNIVISMHYPPRDKKDGVTHSLWGFSSKELYSIIRHYNVKAIFAAHIHKMIDFDWKGIPVYITALNNQSWESNPSAPYRMVRFNKNNLSLETINVKNLNK